MIKNEDKKEKEDSRFSDVKEVIESMFLRKGYPKEKNFDGTVWFLKDDQEFHTKKQSHTPGQTNGNIMHDILIDLSQDRSLKNFSINVGKFAQRIALELYKSEKSKKQTELQKKDYNVEVMFNHIQVLLKEIDRLMFNTIEHVTNPCLSVVLDFVPQFARGKFSIKFILNELLSDGSERTSESTLPLDMTNGDIVSDSNTNNNLAFELISLNGIEKYKKESDHYSGINVNSFKFKILDSAFQPVAVSSEDMLLETIFLNHVEKFIDLSKKNIVLRYRPTFKILNNSYNNIEITMEVIFSINFQVRECILKQIYKIFNNLIVQHKHEVDKISKILNYFKDYSIKIKEYLEGNMENKEACMSCANCNIY